VTAPDDLGREAEELAQTLASKSRLTLTSTKRQVNSVMDAIAPPQSAMADADALLSATRDPESRRAGESYLERRTERSRSA
jgi:enoyl-CoA hydratase/carnithine racemase